MRRFDEPVRVECYAGGRGEETPRRVSCRNHWEDVAVLEGWISEPAEGSARSRWFRVRRANGSIALLYHDEALDAWFRRAPGPGPIRGGEAADGEA